ncbi:MAG: hypothetical protein ISR65_03300 [Bacteriovoracaceae bacterium]|nr:hypothetical protein [Bacteriovoracaceae bacterium]
MGKGKNKKKLRKWEIKKAKNPKVRKPTAPATVAHKSKKDYNRKKKNILIL